MIPVNTSADSPERKEFQVSEKIKVGINGFGRIARVIIRSLEMRDTDIEVRCVNLHNADFKRMAYQMEYD